MINVKNCGAIGVIKDLSKHELPNEAWTDSLNIRFLDGYAYQFYGHGDAYGTPTVAPYHLFPVKVAGVQHWVYCGTGKVYSVYNNAGTYTNTNLTRGSGGDYAGAANTWTSTVLGGLPVINDGSGLNYPQSWDLNLANNFADLPNWPANTYCQVIRTYKNYLIALNITKTTTNYPYMVKWSHPADPGATPASWDEADTTKDAGEFDLSEGYDYIVDGLQLRDSFMIYKSASIWRMDFVGGAYIFRFSKVGGVSGAMNKNCVVEVDGFHFALTTNDIIIHDGSSATSILDKQSRRDLFRSIDATSSSQCFVFKNPFFNEVFVCYPEVGETTCNKALVWNYKDRTVSYREIPSLTHANYGAVDVGLSGSWDSDSEPWDSDLSLWDGPNFVPGASSVLMASAVDDKILLLDASASFNGVAPAAYLERAGLSFGAPDKIKLVRGIRPRITGNVGETVVIKIGSSADPYTPPTYTSMTHTIGSTVSDDCLVSGRYIAVRVESGSAYQWRLDSYDIDVVESGEW